MSPPRAESGQSASICYVAGEGSKPALNPRFPRRELRRRAWPSTGARPVTPSTCGGAAGIEAPERDQDAEDDRLRPRRAAGNIDVDRQNLVDAAGARVTFPDDATGGGAGAHGDHDARVGNSLDGAAHGGLQVARDRAGDHDAVGVARGGDEVDAEATHVVHRVQKGGEFPVAGVAGSCVEMAQVQRAAEHPVDFGRGAGGLGVRVRCWSRREDGRVVGCDLDPQVGASARREFELPSHRDRPGPGILCAAAAEDAAREIEGDAATSCV